MSLAITLFTLIFFRYFYSATSLALLAYLFLSKHKTLPNLYWILVSFLILFSCFSPLYCGSTGLLLGIFLLVIFIFISFNKTSYTVLTPTKFWSLFAIFVIIETLYEYFYFSLVWHINMSLSWQSILLRTTLTYLWIKIQSIYGLLRD